MIVYSRSAKKVVFLVHNNALGEQQQEYLARHTGLSSIGINGLVAPDSWTKNQWSQILSTNQVCFPFIAVALSFELLSLYSFVLLCPVQWLQMPLSRLKRT